MGYPDINYSIKDINNKTVALTGDSTVLIRHHSTALATMNPVAYDGAAIDLDLCIIRNGEDTGYGTEYPFENVASEFFTFSAEDSLGRATSKGVTANMIDYIKLTCNVADSKPDGTGSVVLTCYGSYFNGSFGKQSNTLTVSYRYRVSGGSWSGYTAMTVSTSGLSNNVYYATATLTGLDYELPYDFEFLAEDALMTAGATASKIKTLPVFHWGENDFVFEVPVQAKKSLRLKGDGNYGGYLYFGDGSYAYIAEIADDELTLKAKKLNLEVSNFSVNGQSVAEHGTWTPSLYDSAVRSYAVQSGWYTKVGNVVTVGFYLKATCYSGYESTDIAVFGLPYTPAIASAGGGMCSGALIQTNKNFQCFVAETEGAISTRVQACDDTADLELETSASGCKFPPGGQLTLSGTITYMTY